MFSCFKQKTAYEMRIGYWSSDVCPSDLGGRSRADAGDTPGARRDHRVARPPRRRLTIQIGAASQKPACRHASNTAIATEFDRFRLRLFGRSGSFRRCPVGSALSHSCGRPAVSGPNKKKEGKHEWWG